MRTTLKRIAFYVSLVTLSLFIVACGSSGGGNNNNNNSTNTNTSSPESVARTVFTSLVKFDFESVIPHVCPERREEFSQQFAELTPLLAEQAEAISQLDIDLSNVTYTVNNLTDTSADVLLSGNVTITEGGETLTQDVGTTQNEPLRMTKVDDVWYICSEVL
jgi:hypothetical protein